MPPPAPRIHAAPPFASFWQAGYEGADHVNHAGRPLDMNAETGHLERARADYALLHDFGIRTVRESAGWRLCERDGQFDFSILDARLQAAQELGLQVCWTFCHYGWPDDLDVYSDEFVPRFVRYCTELAKYLKPWTGDTPVYSPINEISFQSWGLSVHMFRVKNMHEPRAAEEGKRQLVRATIAGCDAIWQVSPGARILQCDPLIHVIAPPGRPDWTDQAAGWRASQFDAWDMLCGRREPALGGAERYLDIIGGNYYHSNQWESGTNLRLWWHLDDPRRQPLHQALLELQQRYQRPLLLAETSHVGSGRGVWIRQMAEQAALAVQHGVDLRGVCLYPVIDRPDWDHADHWHKSGLWDVDLHSTPPLARLPVPPYATALHQAIGLTNQLCQPTRESAMQTMIVFCHLRWDFVYQRPQHLLSRLAQYYRVVVVEEPVYAEGAASWETFNPAPNLSVYRPHTPVQAPGFHDDQIPVLKSLLAELPGIDQQPLVWFYTPMALPLLPPGAGLVVYDCMDELSAFRNAPKQLLQREAALLKLADLVFTGGPSLYEAKRQRHDNAHCFASSVDAVHFHQALDRSNGHPLHADIPHPRLGYYGVIDERFDTELIAAIADAHPEWQLVLVGPVVKIDPAALPQRQNIHYFGQQSYQVLPQFLAGWDVCLLPFALNDSTKFISPTKVLEYMAAELPSVSTAITDVEQPYGDIVAIGHDHAEFIAHCEAALALSEAQRAALAQRMRDVVAGTSWENTAERMRALIEQTPPGGRAAAGLTPAPEAASAAVGAANVNPMRGPGATSCIIIGGGPTGLSAAYHLGADTMLLERNASVGGWCRSIKDNGFTFDYAGHIMFSNDPYVLKLYDILLGDNQHWQMREAWVYSKQVYTRYPFQGALYGLPPQVIKECIVGAIESRYGLTETAPKCAPGEVEDCCADGTADVANSGAGAAAAKTENFEDFIYRVWGKGIARHFAIPYNKKIWTVPLKDMETSWLGGRVPLPDLEQIIEGALEPVAKPMGPNARFGYPKRGGFQALMNGLLPHIRGKVELNANVVKVLPQEHTVVLADGRRLPYAQLISTMPLPELVRLCGQAAPAEVRAAAEGLNHVSIRCVNIGVNRTDVTDKHWIYYPEDSIFHRIFVQGNASPECNAPGGFGFTCEISYSPWKPLPVDGEALIQRCIADCIKVGFISAEDTIVAANQVDMPYAYVVYDHARADNVATVRAWMEQHDIILSGRYSEWEYYNSDHAFLAGKKAAERVRASGGVAARSAES
ncbi:MULTISPECIES: NAD(P)-binding protein [unclassified Duganella]|uniref:NAD(P)-binding protein n=1 Tax=unclassified Duganella TaxID=2636909 RepID=UPI00088C9A9A|nr:MULTISPECIES: NAD(P)-binding protein [unclassified Duganella]SDG43156.1 Protoporphyrinogen oxidase [Duganella sp. OV458]SDJ60862.1 Protoporphyrinogen oxidase [Duganella sp. OV510]